MATEMEKRVKVNTWVVAWLTSSPTISIGVRESVTKLYDKNPQLMIVWMAGYGVTP
ncbi:MAG: hypothetical protein WDO16_25305 [Bacteroidota bacterium]